MRYLEIRKEKHDKDWDTVLAIAGPEGVSKSNLGLHIVDGWQTLTKGKCVESDIKRMCMTLDDWRKYFSEVEPNGAIAMDEAGEISSRKAMTKFNADLIIAYQIVRGANLFTLLILPDIKYIDSFFRNSRIKNLAVVYARGRVAFFSKKRLLKLLDKNAYRNIFNYKAVKPTFYDHFPKYNGVMANKYIEIKKKKIKEAQARLDAPENKTYIPENTLKREMYKRFREQGYSKKESANLVGFTERTAYNIEKDWNKEKGK